MNGKGDRIRQGDSEAYRETWDRIYQDPVKVFKEFMSDHRGHKLILMEEPYGMSIGVVCTTCEKSVKVSLSTLFQMNIKPEELRHICFNM